MALGRTDTTANAADPANCTVKPAKTYPVSRGIARPHLTVTTTLPNLNPNVT